ncbi:MAG TPA: M14 family metallocarboxypeptidase, partial [Verrucomicrobiae bacterium]|nr:M14 family metallocarboxypeptidase [Verrucomicrobiae bacterium]
MQRLGKNAGGYFGETIDIRAVLRDVDDTAGRHGWSKEVFFRTGEFELPAFHRGSTMTGQSPRRVYLSAGIHGDEPAGPLAALKLLQENRWPENLEFWLCPCLNPIGFQLNSRANAKGIDLNRGYLNPVADEILAHISWLERQPLFDLCLLLHEDWEAHGFYLYETNPHHLPSFADVMVNAVEKVCPIDRSEMIEGRPASNGV